MRKGHDREKTKTGGRVERKRLIEIVATRSLPAVNCPNTDHWNANCQELLLLELFISARTGLLAGTVHLHSIIDGIGYPHPISQIFTTKRDERVRNIKSHLFIVCGRLVNQEPSMCCVDHIKQSI